MESRKLSTLNSQLPTLNSSRGKWIVVFFGYPLPIVLVFVFLFGSVIGSFLNVCIYRFPRHERFAHQLRALWSPPSRCPRCESLILLRDNIPVIGWLKLGGRCRFCRRRISIRYPLIELGNGLLFVVVYWLEIPDGFSATFSQSGVYWALGPQGIAGSTWSSAAAVLHWRYLYHMVLLESLVVATFIDFDHKIIPDGATLPAMAVGLLGGWAFGQVYLVPLWFQNPNVLRGLEEYLPQWTSAFVGGPRVPEWISHYPHTHGLLVSLTGLLIGGGTVWVIRLIGFWVLRQEAMGFGDVILMAMIGSFLGWQVTLAVFFIAPACALLVVGVSWAIRRDREIPYGPYLSLATLIVLLGWKRVWPVADRIFSTGVLVPALAFIVVLMMVPTLQLIQFAKRLLSIPLYPDEWGEEWTSGDQLAYFANQDVDTQPCDSHAHHWPGIASGRGTVFQKRWRCTCTNGWKQHWQRRKR